MISWSLGKRLTKLTKRLDNLYKNWHAEYTDAATTENAMKLRNFIGPYLDKYESKYRILYHLLQHPSSFPIQETASGMTPSLATSDDVPSLR